MSNILCIHTIQKVSILCDDLTQGVSTIEMDDYIMTLVLFIFLESEELREKGNFASDSCVIHLYADDYRKNKDFSVNC